MIAAECPDRAVGDLPEMAGGYSRSMSTVEQQQGRRRGGGEGRRGGGEGGEPLRGRAGGGGCLPPLKGKQGIQEGTSSFKSRDSYAVD